MSHLKITKFLITQLSVESDYLWDSNTVLITNVESTILRPEKFVQTCKFVQKLQKSTQWGDEENVTVKELLHTLVPSTSTTTQIIRRHSFLIQWV